MYRFIQVHWGHQLWVRMMAAAGEEAFIEESKSPEAIAARHSCSVSFFTMNP
jgi:hypothetical protein